MDSTLSTVTTTLCIAIVSDTHGQLDPRIAAAASKADAVIHGGDIGCAAILDALTPPSGQLHAVVGNNDQPDRWPADDADILAALADEQRLVLPGGTLVVVHGHRHGAPAVRHRRLRQSYPDARAIVYGHSHRLVCDTAGHPWILNPGAAGRARTFGGPSMLMLTINGNHWQLSKQRFALEKKRR